MIATFFASRIYNIQFFAILDSNFFNNFCYPGQQNVLQSRKAKHFAIQDSKTIYNFLLSWIAKLFISMISTFFASRIYNIQFLLSWIAFFLQFLLSWISKCFAIQESKTFCCPGQQTNFQFLLSWIAKLFFYPCQLLFLHPGYTIYNFLLSWLANFLTIFAILDSKTFYYPGQQNFLLSRIAKQFNIFAILDSKTL